MTVRRRMVVPCFSTFLFFSYVTASVPIKPRQLDEPVNPTAIFSWIEDRASDPSRERPISVLVEIGNTIPPLLLLETTSTFQERVSLKLTGPARFHANFPRTLVEYSPAAKQIVLPEIDPGNRYFEESSLRVYAQGEDLLSPLRISVLPEGWVEKVAGIAIFAEDALLFHTDKIAIIDEDLVKWERWEEVSVDHGDKEELNHQHPAWLSPEVDNFDPSEGDPDWCPGWCIRIPFGPGKVQWNVGNPAGLKWSVKPESVGGVLIPAAAPLQAVDGLYAKPWGCGQALKVPDSCTAYAAFPLSPIECCCNHAAALLGHVCRWIDPTPLSDWPNCPLS